MFLVKRLAVLLTLCAVTATLPAGGHTFSGSPAGEFIAGSSMDFRFDEKIPANGDASTGDSQADDYAFAEDIPAENLRIVSLSPSLTKMMVLLEAEDRIAAYTGFCDIPGEDRPVVATQMNVNTEKIVLLDPDLVVTTDLTPAREIQALRATGVHVEILKMPDSFDALSEQLIETGRLTGSKEKAVLIVERERSRLEHIRGTIPPDANHRIFLQLGVKPLFTAVPGTFMHDYIRLTGGENIAASMSQGSISRESVLLRDPEVILIVMPGLAGEEEKKNWMQYPGLSAAENGHIYLLDEDQAASPTPVTFVDTVEKIVGLIYH